jgi:hypothetical protein
MSAYGNDIAHDLLGDSMIDLTHGKGSKIRGAEPQFCNLLDTSRFRSRSNVEVESPV